MTPIACASAGVLVGMIAKSLLTLMAAGTLAWPADWVTEGNRALDQGNFAQATADFVEALKACSANGVRSRDLVHLRVTLATAYLEAGEDRHAEEVLEDAQRAAEPMPDDRSRAELLNAWSVLHLKLGMLPATEKELHEALLIIEKLPDTGDLRPTVLHNLAAVEMRTGRYAESLEHESEATRRFALILPADHPTLIRCRASLAALEYMMGQPRSAKASMEQAIAAAERTYGPTHPLLADLLISDAVILDRLKQRKEARLARERAAQISAALPRDSASWNVREPAAGQVSLRSK